MNIAERDALIVDKLAQVMATGLSGQQAVNEVVRIMGHDFITVGDTTRTGLVTDVTNIQQAVADLTVTANRTVASTQLSATTGSTGVRFVRTPKPDGVSSTDHYRMRVVAAGK